MVNSVAHEALCVATRDKFFVAMQKQEALNPSLAKWQLHTNLPIWYHDDADEECTPDMTLVFQNVPLFGTEVAFTQSWDALRLKIDRMLIDKNMRGVLVIKLTEHSDKFTWSKPTRVATYNDFVTFADFDAEMQRAQTDAGYGALLSMFGWDWMKEVRCEVYLFPGEWKVGIADPRAVSEPTSSFIIYLQLCSIP